MPGRDGTETVRIEDGEPLGDGATRYRERVDISPGTLVGGIIPTGIRDRLVPPLDHCSVCLLSVDRWSIQTCTQLVEERAQLRYTDGLQIDRHYSDGAPTLDESPDRIVEGPLWMRSYVLTDTYQNGGGPVIESSWRPSEEWVVVAASERVTVPAGSFDALHLYSMTNAWGASAWYVPGVGMVKRSASVSDDPHTFGAARVVEELTDYTIP